MPETALEELARDDSSRKRFLKMVGGTGAAGALGILIAACGGDDKKKSDTGSGSSSTTKKKSASASSASSKGDLKILNYALTLEYLEADFYKQAIDSGLVKDKKVATIATKFGSTEQEHVDALTATIKKLGGKPVSAPKTNFQPIFDGGLMKVLTTAADVENLGAAAYLGQAGKIENKEVLAAALAIHTVEARHAAALNKLVGRKFKGSGPLNGSIPDGAFAKPMDMAAVLKAAKPFIAS